MGSSIRFHTKSAGSTGLGICSPHRTEFGHGPKQGSSNLPSKVLSLSYYHSDILEGTGSDDLNLQGNNCLRCTVSPSLILQGNRFQQSKGLDFADRCRHCQARRALAPTILLDSNIHQRKGSDSPHYLHRCIQLDTGLGSTFRHCHSSRRRGKAPAGQIRRGSKTRHYSSGDSPNSAGRRNRPGTGMWRWSRSGNSGPAGTKTTGWPPGSSIRRCTGYRSPSSSDRSCRFRRGSPVSPRRRSTDPTGSRACSKGSGKSNPPGRV